MLYDVAQIVDLILWGLLGTESLFYSGWKNANTNIDACLVEPIN